MTNIIYTKVYDPPEINKKEILRYAGVHGDAPELEETLQSCLRELDGKLTYKICYCEFPIVHYDGYIDLGFSKATSSALKRNLTGCESIVLFAGTIGIGLDRLIARYSSVSPVKSFMFQAIGAERIESLCDVFNDEIDAQKTEEGYSTRPRFSPGYGDLPLDAQQSIFNVLDCPRKIGLTLNQSMLMSPSKSVTALIGVSKEICGAKHKENCEICSKKDCLYRKVLP